jgi:hypothetical protein
MLLTGVPLAELTAPAVARTAEAPVVECPTCPANTKEPCDMKVKWKKNVARLVPATTMIAAVVVAVARTASVKWG